MKNLSLALGILTVSSVALVAQETQTTETTEVRQNADGSVTKDTTTITTTFNPAARQKVVTYFEGYKGNPHGLPPGWAGKIQVKALPTEWWTTRLAPGTVISETQRSYLVEPTPDLVELLPDSRAGVRYYVAGSNVVAVDSGYRVVDSIQIPTINYSSADGEDVEFEATRNGKKVEVEVDGDDGEVEIEED